MLVRVDPGELYESVETALRDWRSWELTSGNAGAFLRHAHRQMHPA